MRSQRRTVSLTATIRRALSDAKWHTQGELLALGMRLVRPEVAVRHWMRRKHARDQPLEEQVRLGAMGVVGQVITNLGVERMSGPGMIRSYRLKPVEKPRAQCLQCNRSFERGIKHRRFCSKDCGRKYVNANRVAKYQAAKQKTA